MKKLTALLLSFLLILCACKSSEPPATPLPEYQIAESSVNSLPGKEHCTYKIILSPDCTDNELLSVAQFLLDDGYDLHDFFFYRKSEEVSSMYTVGKIREENNGSLTLKRTGGLVEHRDALYPDNASSIE